MSSSDDQTGCQALLHPQAIIGIELFNNGEYFEAHEALETAWMEEPGQIRDLYRGILQVAVAYYHIQRGNFIGARKMLIRCRPWLSSFPAICQGIDVEGLRSHVELIERELIRLGADHLRDLDPSMLQPVSFDSL